MSSTDRLPRELVALMHDTAARSVPVATAGFGLASFDHFVPFQRSTSVRGVPAGSPGTA